MPVYGFSLSLSGKKIFTGKLAAVLMWFAVRFSYPKLQPTWRAFCDRLVGTLS